MDKPADPAAPFGEVYQSFLDDLALEGLKPSTIHRYRYNIVRFPKWLVAHGRPATLASLERTTLIAYKQHLETLPQQPKGSIRRRRGGLMSSLPSIRTCGASRAWQAEGRGPSGRQPVPGRQPLLQEEGRDARPAGRRPDPEDRQAVRRRDPAGRVRGRPARGPPRPGDGVPGLCASEPREHGSPDGQPSGGQRALRRATDFDRWPIGAADTGRTGSQPCESTVRRSAGTGSSVRSVHRVLRTADRRCGGHRAAGPRGRSRNGRGGWRGRGATKTLSAERGNLRPT